MNFPEVSGDVVNLAVLGTYVLHYDCEDILNAQAVRVSRTVIVVAAPRRALGAGENNSRRRSLQVIWSYVTQSNYMESAHSTTWFSSSLTWLKLNIM